MRLSLRPRERAVFNGFKELNEKKKRNPNMTKLHAFTLNLILKLNLV